MSRRDQLLMYARHLSDQRIHRVVGKCIAEYSRQVMVPAEPTTLTNKTILASLLPDLPDTAIDRLLSIAQGMSEATPEQCEGIALILALRPDYAHMVRVFAKSLHDAQTAIQLPQEGNEA